MIDVDGHMVDPKEVAAVTKITFDASGYTSVSGSFDIFLKSGQLIRIKRSLPADSSSSQMEGAKELATTLAYIRNPVIEALPK